MKQYKHFAYDYVSIVEIDKSEVIAYDFAACKQPRETLGSYYNRQTIKPDVLVNAGFFNMKNGVPCFNNIDEGKIRSRDDNYLIGMGTAIDKKNELLFGSLNSDIKWNDFLSAYPVLLDGNGPITKFTVGSEINYNATRSVLGFNDNRVYVIHIGKPGMNFNTISKMLYNMGIKYAINLDGGGSARLMVNGSVYGNPTENRSVDSVLAIYLNKADSRGTEGEGIVVGDTPYVLYTVVKGDSWWKIAANKMGSGNKCEELAKYNNKTTSSIIYPGDIIKIPV